MEIGVEDEGEKGSEGRCGGEGEIKRGYLIGCFLKLEVSNTRYFSWLGQMQL